MPSESRLSVWSWLSRWRGVLLATVAVVATIWLAVTDQLVLYIHPRYVIFTVTMAVIALGLTIASVMVRRGHEHPERTSRTQKAISGVVVVVTLAIAVTMVVVPPATLTSATAAQREVNAGAVSVDSEVSEAAASVDSLTLTLRDWASLVRQTTDLDFYADKPIDAVGFIAEDPSDPDNQFFVSRFAITCCAVDAQPVGVAVYLPHWQDRFALYEWVHISGAFDTNPSTASDAAIVVIPAQIEKVPMPDDSYLF